MSKDFIAIKRKALPLLKKSGVKRASIFGSFARGEETKKSDVDFLAEFPKGFTLLDLIALERQLKEKIGRDVDVIAYKSIYEPLRERILAEAIPIL